ncbi:hypothetical protein DAERI_290003 [Deinococcus aerius]|uniref:Uncharacterized protein n=1 Tax=Deinococcus aerius TaxID=200253 RepID=A0A2I9DBC8_9DEIO|nr:hypothetical protein [Deinococcus aerius]GBF08256.1 hypothetical protein DAERI_290003 [Deinococcus aerius]
MRVLTPALAHPELSPLDLSAPWAGFSMNALRTTLAHFTVSVLREARRERTFFHHV